MEFDMAALPKASRYKIMSSCITPRPIAWVTTLSSDGLVNAAPFSFFNMMGDDPPTVVLGLLQHGEQRLKDTAYNIRENGEFVVNLVDEANAAAMNLTCIDAPADVSEIDLAGVKTSPGVAVAVPRIATAPACFECRELYIIETGPDQLVVIGQVVHAFVRDQYVLDRDRLYIDAPAMRLIARMHGAGIYSRQTDLFEMQRPTWPQHIADASPNI
jgi:flavin reductase (DIM6/NTAB) family NADH-FMN oxidoreductase RutF